MFPRPSAADQIVNMHPVSKQDRQLIKKIFENDPDLKQRFDDKQDEYHIKYSYIYMARINLDHAPEPEIATWISGNWVSGTVGEEFFIWKRENGVWTQLVVDYLRDLPYFHITNRIVNGYPVLRYPHDENVRVYGPDGYWCPHCPRG